MRRLKILLFVVLSLTATQHHQSMRSISLLIIHCSAVRPGQQSSAKDIDLWHRQRGWRMIGYHYVVRRNGTVEKGRAEETTGAHCVGHNAHSIGICYEGGLDANGKPSDTRTPQQKVALRKLLAELRKKSPRRLSWDITTSTPRRRVPASVFLNTLICSPEAQI